MKFETNANEQSATSRLLGQRYQPLFVINIVYSIVSLCNFLANNYMLLRFLFLLFIIYYFIFFYYFLIFIFNFNFLRFYAFYFFL